MSTGDSPTGTTMTESAGTAVDAARTDSPTVVLADDSALLREGVAGLLGRQGFDVVAQVADADELRSCVRDLAARGALPDVVVTDVRMPPTMTNDGLLAAMDLKREVDVAVMVVSQYVSPTYAQQLFSLPSASGTGYLLKDRVSEVTDFVASLRVVAAGGVTIDPEVTRAIMRSRTAGLGDLTPRERDVLELMSRGLSNSQIAAELFVSGAAVAKHVANIFTKLGLEAHEENRRVRVILTYLGEAGRP